MGPLLNAIRLQALRANADQAISAYGEVTNFSPNTWSVRVRLLPESVITGWLPLASPWIGNGWGMFAAPSIGDLVSVHFSRGDIDAGIAETRLFNDQQRPLPVASGEFWLVHQSGSFIKLTNAGQLLAQDKAGSTLTMNGDGTISAQCSGQAHLTAGSLLVDAPTTINGNTTINGTLSVSSDISSGTKVTAPQVVGTTDVTFAGKSAVAHKHGGVQTGSGQTGVPA